MRTRYRQRQLAEAFDWIEAQYGLAAFDDYYQGVRGSIEGVAHELAHFVDMGENPRWEDELRSRSDAVNNRREAATLRIEVRAMAKFNIKLGLRYLWRTANWQGGEKPVWTYMTRPSTRHEDRCVKRMVAIINNALSLGLEG